MKRLLIHRGSKYGNPANSLLSIVDFGPSRRHDWNKQIGFISPFITSLSNLLKGKEYQVYSGLNKLGNYRSEKAVPGCTETYFQKLLVTTSLSNVLRKIVISKNLSIAHLGGSLRNIICRCFRVNFRIIESCFVVPYLLFDTSLHVWR